MSFAKSFRPYASLLAWAFVTGNFCSHAIGGEPWVKIEEDWELVLNQPDATTFSPQLTIYLTPQSTLPSTYFLLQLNHAADADFSGGGFRVSAIADNQPLQEARSQTRALLTCDGDEVRWTSVMAIRSGEILFAVKDGTSQSWGEFGGPEYLLRIPSNGMEDLSLYTPRQSIEEVDIGYGKNRVRSLKLRTVRAYRGDNTSISVNVNLDAI